ncbi:hypothetical protein Tco_0792229 [Tanacetum coccineum]
MVVCLRRSSRREAMSLRILISESSNEYTNFKIPSSNDVGIMPYNVLVDLVVHRSVQVDVFRTENAVKVLVDLVVHRSVQVDVFRTENAVKDEAGAVALKTVELDAAIEGHSFQYREVSVNNGLLLSMLFELHVAFCYCGYLEQWNTFCGERDIKENIDYHRLY